MKVLWVHNFDKKKNINSGVFMYEQLEQLRSNNLDIELFCINSRSIFKTIKDFLYLRSTIKRYDLIHAQYGSFVGFFVSFLPARKKIISLRGTDYYGVPPITFRNKIFNFFSRFFTFNSLKRFDAVITMSNRMTSEIIAKFPLKKINTLTDGILLERFKKRKRQQPSQEPLKILFSSIKNDNPVKRVHLATGAVNILKQRNKNVELVPMMGIPHSDVPDFISKCDIVLLTSTHEGWPNIIKECLTVDIPFVSTDVSDLHEIAAVENSCFVTEPVSEKLADAIEKLIDMSDRPNLSLKKYVEHMDMKCFANNLLAIYKAT